jgi:hypothetical protein
MMKLSGLESVEGRASWSLPTLGTLPLGIVGTWPAARPGLCLATPCRQKDFARLCEKVENKQTMNVPTFGL